LEPLTLYHILIIKPAMFVGVDYKVLVRSSSLAESMSCYLICRIEESHKIELRTHTEIVGVGGASNQYPSNQHPFIIT